MIAILRRVVIVSAGLLGLLLLQPVNSPVAYGDECCYDPCCCCADVPEPPDDGAGCQKCSKDSTSVTLEKYQPGLVLSMPAQAVVDYLLSQDNVVYLKLDGDEIEHIFAFPSSDRDSEPLTWTMCVPGFPGECDKPYWKGCIDPNIYAPMTGYWTYREAKCDGAIYTRYKYLPDEQGDGDWRNEPAERSFACVDYEGVER